MRAHRKPPNNWARLLSDTAVGWPWPYTTDEIAGIRSALGRAVHIDKALQAIVAEARRFLSPPAAEARDAEKKPDARSQVAAVALAIKRVREALEGLDQEAIEYLNWYAAVPDERPIAYLEATYAFEYNPGIETLPEASPGPGRRPNLHIGFLQLRLEQIYIAAHSGNRPTRGWPGFRDACLDPIDPAPVADSKTRQDQLRAAKGRKNSAAKGLIIPGEPN